MKDGDIQKRAIKGKREYNYKYYILYIWNWKVNISYTGLMKPVIVLNYSTDTIKCMR